MDLLLREPEKPVLKKWFGGAPAEQPETDRQENKQGNLLGTKALHGIRLDQTQ